MYMNAAKKSKMLAGGAINWYQLQTGVNDSIKAKHGVSLAVIFPKEQAFTCRDSRNINN
jgi:hypothetical protein